MENLDLLNSAKVFLHKLLFEYGVSLITAIIILYVGWKLINLLHKAFLKLLTKKEVEASVQYFLGKTLNIALKILLIISVMTHIGIEMTSFIAMLGAAGLAIGMALQGTLQNFAGGLIVLILKPLKIGDYIESNGYNGTVERIQIFNTFLNTPDNKTIIVPNSELATKAIINYTKTENRRVDINVGVAYGENIANVRAIMLKTLENDSRILNHPEPMVVLTEMADSSLNVSLRIYVKPDYYWNVFYEYNETIYNKLTENNVNIPFPQMDVHISKNL